MTRKFLALAAAGALAVPSIAAGQQAEPEGSSVVPRTIAGQMVLFDQTNYNGRTWTLDSASSRVRTDWNIRSLAIHPGERWQICARPRFRDPCIVLDRSVHDATLIGVEGQIGSARPAPEESAEAE